MLVSTPSMYFFFTGFPMTSVSETWNQTESGMDRKLFFVVYSILVDHHKVFESSI